MNQFSSHPLYKKHDLDSVMVSMWTFYKKHFLALFLASFVANVIIQLITASIDLQKINGITDPIEILSVFKTWLLPMTGTLAITLVLSLILQYFVLYKPVNGEITIFNSIYKSLRYLLPFLLLMILFIVFAAVATAAGLIVFVIGAFFALLYVFMISLFILPVLMVEGNNIGNTISRSFTLSHRHFGPNLGYSAIFILIIIVGTVVLSSLVLFPFSGSFLKILMHPEEASEAMNFMQDPIFIILSALASSIFTPLTPIFGTILYFNGRAREDETEKPGIVNNEPDRIKVEDLYAKPYSEDHPDNPDNK